MKKLLTSLGMAGALALGAQPALAQDFDAGVAAYEADDFEAALAEFRPLAEQGDAKAQFKLGVMYATGQGVAQDMVRAYMWFDLAAALGNDNGRRYRDLAARSLSPEQIAEAQRRAAECKAREYKDC